MNRQLIAPGHLVVLAALGMMATLVSGDISEVQSWAEVFEPAFVGMMLAHFGVVIGAYVGGRLIK